MKNKISTLLFAVLARDCMVNAASSNNIQIGDLYYNLYSTQNWDIDKFVLTY